MKLRFKNFQFDCEQQILTQDGNVLTLNEKPAQLLTLFLRDSDKIHSKENILAFVWPDRVVTDQVVFQNISYLRSLFGSNAIKTFTRKGYQWQLPLELDEGEEKYPPEELTSAASRQEESNQVSLGDSSGRPVSFFQNNFPANKLIFSFIAFSFLLISWLWLTPNITEPVIPIMTHSQSMTSDKTYAVSIEEQQLKITPLVALVSPQTLFDSPFSTWQKYSAGTQRLLVAIKLYSVQEKTALRFHIQGASHGWSDYIWAENKNQALNRFNSLLSLITTSNYFSISLNHEILAKLTLFVNEQPENELLNQQLIKQMFKLHDLGRANALIDQQLAAKPSLFRQGMLNLLKTDISMRNKQWAEAKQSIVQALTIFEELKLPQLEARALMVSSWGFLFEKKFRSGMQVLNQAASKARESHQPLLEVKAHIIQSFIASKAGQMELAHTQLNLAKEITDLHQLSGEHQVAIENNLGWIAKSSTDALQHYQNILNMPFSLQYESHFYNASTRVREAYIKQENWEKALTSINSWQRSSFQALNRAYIAYAQGNWQQGLMYANKAFQKAQADHHKIDALNAALLILENQNHEKQRLETNKFDTFIKQNSTRIWLGQNGVKLDKLKKLNKAIN
jgi:DNA-binding winged helix-turn-helix (wHTH) protein